MADWRVIKEAMRQRVHGTFRGAANLYRGSAPPVVVYARLQNVAETFHGDLMGTTANYAVTQEQNPIIIYLNAEWQAQRGDVLCFRAGEAFTVDNVQRPVNITTTAEVLPVPAKDISKYSPPASP